MSLDKVIEKIRSTGEAEAQSIRDQAEAERESILAEARKAAEAQKKERMAAAEAARERIMTQELARAELQSKKIALAAEKEVLDLVLKTARERIAASPRREELVIALLRAHREEASSGRILSSPEDAGAVRASGFAPAGTIDCLGGVVIESADGSRREDLRFETILDEVWRDSVREVADILWREERT
jgi:V/A-type H+-transporting ATPase subunit E